MVDWTPPTIKELLAMSEDDMMEFFGFKDKVRTAREELEQIDRLPGKARDIAEEKIQNMLTPHAYPEEFGWIRQSARKEARLENTGLEELQDASPDILD